MSAMTSEHTDLIAEYSAKIKPILPLAKKAYGARNQSTPAHDASREYTRLLVEFQDRGGSLADLAKELGVAYAGLRRRVVMRNVAVSKARVKSRGTSVGVTDSVARILAAKSISVDAYHDQLADEYRAGISLAAIAKEMGLSSSAPLYYGVQRSLQRHGHLDETAMDPRTVTVTPAASPTVPLEQVEMVETFQIEDENVAIETATIFED